MSDREDNRSGSGKNLIFPLLAVVLMVTLFLYGVIVGYYQVGPFQAVKPLIVPEAEENVAATQSLKQQPTTSLFKLPTFVSTGLLNLNIEWLNPSNPVLGEGGGISLFEEDVVVTKDHYGAVWYYDSSEREFFQLRIFLPLNNTLDIPTKTPTGGKVHRLRYNNAAVYELGGLQYMLATYGYFDKQNHCRTIRVARATLPSNWNEKPTNSNQGLELDWQVLFTAEPCLTFDDGKEYVTGYQEGAALLIHNGYAYFTTGDMGRDGVDGRDPMVLQSDESDFGNAFRVSLETGKVEKIVFGLRNTQGLAVDKQGQLWSTDQGPMGGDELNLLEVGKNYGWPYVTYGANYTDQNQDKREWPYQPVLGKHEKYELPHFVWTPSISPSSITVANEFHPNWQGNLLVGSLNLGAIVRLTMDDGKVINAENIRIQNRVRSLLAHQQRLYVLTDKGHVGVITPRATDTTISSDVQQALQLLASERCTECHQGSAVPSLANIIGQPIAGQSGIDYSTALKTLQPQRWNKQNLVRFLTEQKAFTPGTTMPDPALSETAATKIVEALEVLKTQ